MNNVYSLVREKIDQADAVLIGASNGLSISEGFNLFADDAWFRENFGDFRQKFGIRSVLQGAFFPFPTQEEKWAFWSRLVYRKSYAEPPSRVMQVLYQLVANKDYFVVTSNGEDHFIPAGFSAERVFELEGKFTENGCEHGCHDGAYPNREDIIRMAEAEHDGRVPSELLPKCPKCGGDMKIHMAADQSFFQSARWRKKQADYQSFVQKYHNRKLLILEFGVGWRNQMIKAPFMQIVASNPHAFYVTFNKGELFIPHEIAERSVGIDQDITSALETILQQKDHQE